MSYLNRPLHKATAPVLLICSACAIGLLAWKTVFSYHVPAPHDYLVVQPVNAQQPVTTTLIAVGDIMLGRTVEKKMQRYGWDSPYEAIREYVAGAAIAFANLEAPFIDGVVVEPYDTVFRAPPAAAPALAQAGFDVVSLANNHIKNQGAAGIIQTRSVLDSVGIAYIGAGVNDTTARQPALIERNGLVFGFLAYTDSAFTPAAYEATAERAGSPFLRIDRMQHDVRQLRGQADVVIVSMHAGIEYSHNPNQTQINFARAAIDAGAHLVLGHHPHVLQPAEQYQDGYIIYSLGNFIFDQMWSAATRQSVVASLTFTDAKLTDVHYTPLQIFDYYQPRSAGEETAQAIKSIVSDFTF